MKNYINFPAMLSSTGIDEIDTSIGVEFFQSIISKIDTIEDNDDWEFKTASN